MKKFLLAILTAAILAIAAPEPSEAQVPSRSTATVTLGVATYTNLSDYAVVRLDQVYFSGVLPVTAFTGTVSRVSALTGVTNSLGAIVGTTGSSPTTNVTPWLFRGDVLRLTGIGTNAGTAELILLNHQ